MAKKLYALVVGINQYYFPFQSLGGCVADAENVVEYLKNKETTLEPEIRLLTNEGATKEKIVKYFREHFSKAEAGDTVLFHFAGHGQQEEADPEVWGAEGDGLLECIVCYNEADDFRLADKELRYLIHELHKEKPEVHIVLLFDCCHSSDNNRAGIILEAYPDAQARRVGINGGQREWKQFIFSDKLSREDFIGKHISEVIPEGKHMHLAACLPHEFAWEIGGKGIFTKNLIEVLERCDGEISYYDLQQRIRYYVKEHKEQHPQVYAEGTDSNQLFQCFLGKDADTQPMGLRVYYNKSNLRIDMGALNGISAGTQVSIVLPDERTITSKVETTTDDYATLVFPEGEELIEGQEYKGYIKGFMTAPVNIYLNDENGDIDVVNKLKTEIDRLENVFLTETDMQADYTVVLRSGRFSITYPSDYLRPIIETVPTQDMGAMLSDLAHLAKWSYVKEFKNHNPSFFRDNSFINLKVHAQQDDGEWKVVEQHRNIVDLPTYLREGKRKGKVKFELTNTSNQRLYCALLYMPNNFGVYSLLPQHPMPIEVGATIFADKYGAELDLVLEEHTQVYNWEKENHYLKLMVSTAPNLNPVDFLLDARPKPQTFDSPLTTSTRGIVLNKKIKDDWTVKEIGLEILNANHNCVPVNIVNRMQQHPLLKEYAERLYFDESGNLRQDITC